MQNTQSTSALAHSSNFNVSDLDATNVTRPCLVRVAEMPFHEGPGERGAFMLTGAQTGGRVTLSTAEVNAHSGPPPHIHANEDEIFLVQSGAFEIFVNGELVTVRAGDVVFGARGEAHRFRGLDSGETNHFNVIIPPSGFEHFMFKWVGLFKDGAPDMETAFALAAEYGITLFPSDEMTPVLPDSRSKVVRAGRTPLQVMGTQITVLLGGADIGGQYSLLRMEGPRDAGPPLHVHANEDEMFMVEAGQVEFTLGEETFLARTGDVVWAPRGYAHTFRLASDDARLAVFVTPGGLDEFFVECALTELAGEASPATSAILCERFGMQLLLPSTS